MNITKNQRRLLNGLCFCPTFESQVALAEGIWDCKFKEMRRSWSRLQNLGLVEWVSQDQTVYEPRWSITDAGLSYLAETDG